MNFKKIVEKVEEDISLGKLDEACVSLHGLIFLFPGEVFLREYLAKVYLKLENPEMAGRYGYLLENKTPEIEFACQAFEQVNNNDFLQIFYRIVEDFGGRKENIIGTSAEEPMRNLQEKANQQKIEEGWKHLPIDFFAEPEVLSEAEERKTTWFLRGCLLAIFVVLVLAIIGFFTIVDLLKN